MNSISPSSIIRYKAEVEKLFELPIKTRLYSPQEGPNKSMFVCSQRGEIIKFDKEGKFSVSLTIPGQPIGIIFKNKEEESNNQSAEIQKKEENAKKDENYYFADVANSAIFEKKGENEVNVLIKSYKGNPLIGPTSLTLNNDENSMFFCDGGYFETTSLSKPNGSLYLYDLENKIVTPLLLNCLAYPSSVYYDNSYFVGYIAETFNNRILKITQNPPGIYHVSVFFVFNGRIGPTSITSDEEGNVFVSRFDYQNKNGDNDGIISVINKDGYLIGELIVPKMSEINGIFIPVNQGEESKRTDTVLYFTENNFSGLLKVKIGGFLVEIDKIQDNFKIY